MNIVLKSDVKDHLTILLSIIVCGFVLTEFSSVAVKSLMTSADYNHY